MLLWIVIVLTKETVVVIGRTNSQKARLNLSFINKYYYLPLT
jgi:hypothetical protein